MTFIDQIQAAIIKQKDYLLGVEAHLPVEDESLEFEFDLHAVERRISQVLHDITYMYHGDREAMKKSMDELDYLEGLKTSMKMDDFDLNDLIEWENS